MKETKMSKFIKYLAATMIVVSLVSMCGCTSQPKTAEEQMAYEAAMKLKNHLKDKTSLLIEDDVMIVEVSKDAKESYTDQSEYYSTFTITVTRPIKDDIKYIIIPYSAKNEYGGRKSEECIVRVVNDGEPELIADYSEIFDEYADFNEDLWDFAFYADSGYLNVIHVFSKEDIAEWVHCEFLS